MSLFSAIDRRINADAWFCGLSQHAQLIWLRLLTGSHVTPVAGLWPAREVSLADEFKFTLTSFRKHFAELQKEKASNGLPRAVADWKRGVLWLPNAIKQDCNQPNNWKTLQGWFKYLDMVPECDVTASGLRQFGDWVDENRTRLNIAKGCPNPFLDCLVNSWRNGIGYRHTRDRARDQDQEPEQEPEREQDHGSNVTPIRLPMHAGWRPPEPVIQSFRVALIPDWGWEQILGRFRTHFAANSQDIRTETQWAQACSRWIFADWGNPSKRPAKPPTVPDLMQVGENPAERALREAGL